MVLLTIPPSVSHYPTSACRLTQSIYYCRFSTSVRHTNPILPGRAEVPYDNYLYIYLVYCLFCSFILCAVLWHCGLKKINEFLVTLLFETSCSDPQSDLFKKCTFVSLPYKSRISDILVICMTSSFLGIKSQSNHFKLNRLT